MNEPSSVSGEPQHRLILLMKDMEAEFFEGFIARMAPTLACARVRNREELCRETGNSIAPTRLIAFSTNVIVPKDVLEQLNWNCINFHPGPPECPGYRPTGFALYRGDRHYGVTGHYMTERVDEGPIIGVDRFDLPDEPWLIDVVKESYQRLARLFLSLLPVLIHVETPIPRLSETWSGEKTTKAQYEGFRRVTPSLSETELKKRFRCFDGIYSPLTDAPFIGPDEI